MPTKIIRLVFIALFASAVFAQLSAAGPLDRVLRIAA